MIFSDRHFPTVTEFFGYTFHFAGIIVGPVFFYKDYLEFIDGSNYDQDKQDSNQVLTFIIKKL